MITTLLDKDIEVTINGEGVFINDAKVTVADIEADNGVVHVIDAVLIPPVETGILNLAGDTKELTVFPNPAKDYIRLSGLTDVNQGTLKIVDVKGAVVLTKNLINLSDFIDISGLDSGSYVLLLNTKKGRYSQKLFIR
jgi:transforming growth factor-beta-induced protein